MSKLYGLLTSDTRAAPATSTGHKEITATLCYGSAGDSRIAAQISARYDAESDTFYLDIDAGDQHETIELDNGDPYGAGYHGPNADDGTELDSIEKVEQDRQFAKFTPPERGE